MDHVSSTRPVTELDTAPAEGLAALGLAHNPFAGTGTFVPLGAQQSALREIDRWISTVSSDPARPDRLAVLTGQPGLGKSRLLREIAGTAPARVTMPVIDPGKGGLTDAQLLRAIIDAFGGTATGRTGMDLRRDIRLALADLPTGTAPGLLIDDADFTGSRLELIRNVLRDGADLGLWIVLAGQPDLADRLTRRRSFRAILGPVVTMEALDADASADLLRTRIESVSSRRRSLVTPDALEMLVETAEGNPGRLLRIAELGLMAAARQGREELDRTSVQLAIQQMRALQDAGEGAIVPGAVVQAEMPLLAAGEPGGSSRTTTQRSLWEGGTGDEAAPD